MISRNNTKILLLTMEEIHLNLKLLKVKLMSFMLTFTQ